MAGRNYIAAPAGRGAESLQHAEQAGRRVRVDGGRACFKAHDDIYKPVGKNTGAAIVVFPGGGYRMLAIDLEGTEVWDWVTRMGVTCVLLKYRVPGSGTLVVG